jgi:putative SOS response-associated peptidase YedK
MDLRDTFDLVELPPEEEMPPRYNLAPTQQLAVIRVPGKLELLKWGPGLINVKLEGVSVKPQNRCLVVVDGFFEWRRGDKQPFYFHRPDKKPFAVGGQARTSVKSCAIVTCAAGPGMKDIHHRMPVVLAREQWSSWLAGEKIQGSLAEIERYPVSTHVNSFKNDDPKCVERILESEIGRAKQS